MSHAGMIVGIPVIWRLAPWNLRVSAFTARSKAVVSNLRIRLLRPGSVNLPMLIYHFGRKSYRADKKLCPFCARYPDVVNSFGWP